MLNNIKFVNHYLNSNEITKLNLGCGEFRLDGWLNTDKFPIRYPSVLKLDVSEKFELPDNSIDYIYSEHLFEHLTYREASNMLSECYRVLKPNGIIRIATPNLEFLMDLYLHPEKEINKEFLEFDANRTGQPNNPVYVINHFHTAWGHKIIYDPETLKSFLESVGFKNIVQCEVGKSSHSELNNIEQHQNYFKKHDAEYDFNLLQTMILEGEK